MTRIFESSHRLGLSAAAALLLAAPPALADSVFERFVNFHYIASQIDSGPNGGDSVDSDIGAGFQITSGFWDYGRLIAEVDIRKYDDGSADFDLQSSSVGIGAGTFLLDRVYVMGALSYDDFRTRLEDSAQPTPNNTVGPFVQTGGEDGLGLQLGLGVELIEALEDGVVRRARCGQNLRGRDAPALPVQQHEVGEGSTSVDGNGKTFQFCLPAGVPPHLSRFDYGCDCAAQQIQSFIEFLVLHRQRRSNPHRTARSS